MIGLQVAQIKHGPNLILASLRILAYLWCVTVPARVELFRLLGDEDRLRLLALCTENELTVGELATLLGASQPQVTKKSQPLREAGLLTARRDGTRTLLRADLDAGAITEAALAEGRTLCSKDGSLSRVAAIIAAREEDSRRFFEERPGDPVPPTTTDEVGALGSWLPMFAPLLPGHALAVDVGTGEGTLLPILSPLYERVIAVDRSPARLARCASHIATWGLPNVRLREGEVDDAALGEEIATRGGADLVAMARVLHHAARPGDAIVAAARLLRRGGHLVIVDYLPHDDETMREQGDVWLGFPPAKLATWLTEAALETIVVIPTGSHRGEHPPRVLAVGKKPTRPN